MLQDILSVPMSYFNLCLRGIFWLWTYHIFPYLSKSDRTDRRNCRLLMTGCHRVLLFTIHSIPELHIYYIYIYCFFTNHGLFMQRCSWGISTRHTVISCKYRSRSRKDVLSWYEAGSNHNMGCIFSNFAGLKLTHVRTKITTHTHTVVLVPQIIPQASLDDSFIGLDRQVIIPYCIRIECITRFHSVFGCSSFYPRLIVLHHT